MLAVAEQMDLSQNVFQDGTWGTLRYKTPSHILTPCCLLATMMAVDMGLMQMNACMDSACLAVCVLGNGSAEREHPACLPWCSPC